MYDFIHSYSRAPFGFPMSPYFLHKTLSNFSVVFFRNSGGLPRTIIAERLTYRESARMCLIYVQTYTFNVPPTMTIREVIN